MGAGLAPQGQAAVPSAGRATPSVRRAPRARAARFRPHVSTLHGRGPCDLEMWATPPPPAVPPTTPQRGPASSQPSSRRAPHRRCGVDLQPPPHDGQRRGWPQRHPDSGARHRHGHPRARPARHRTTRRRPRISSSGQGQGPRLRGIPGQHRRVARRQQLERHQRKQHQRRNGRRELHARLTPLTHEPPASPAVADTRTGLLQPGTTSGTGIDTRTRPPSSRDTDDDDETLRAAALPSRPTAAARAPARAADAASHAVCPASTTSHAIAHASTSAGTTATSSTVA
jgi:hypothetical protein